MYAGVKLCSRFHVLAIPLRRGGLYRALPCHEYKAAECSLLGTTGA